MSMTSSDVAPIRHGCIGDRGIWVFDGLLPAHSVATMVNALDRAPFTRTEVATPDTPQYRHWACEMDLRVLTGLPLHQATLKAMAHVAPDRHYRAYRAYTNFASYGDVLMIHTDCVPGADEFTALWYLANDWDADWGGETVFYDDDRDARFIVSPRPGRLVIFDGSIPHAGRPPARQCTTARYSFAIKLERDPMAN
jgi:SM-20-related protein